MTEKTPIDSSDDSVDDKFRIYASISFAVLLLVIGVPLWWHTTAVPRVALPYAGISKLSNLNIRIQSRIFIGTTSRTRADLIAELVTRAFENSTLFNLDVSSRVILSDLGSSAITAQTYEKVIESFHLKTGDLLLLEAPSISNTLIGNKRVIFFSKRTDASKLVDVLTEVILRDKAIVLTREALTDPTKYRLDAKNRRRFPASSTYDILLTVVNPNPEKLRVNWNLLSLAKDYLEPFLDQLAPVANFTVKSQWLYMMSLDITPRQILDSTPAGRHFALPEDILPKLITPLEKKLASQVSLHPCINLVTYVVPCSESPLHIYTKSGQRSQSFNNVETFLSPRWGGVVIYNPPSQVCAEARDKSHDQPVEVTPNTVAIIGTFLAHLRHLLGVPNPDDLVPDVTVSPLVELHLRDWEHDALLRIRAVEQLTSAKLTLQSLAQLLEEISNIVITQTVGSQIKQALELVERSAESLAVGQLEEGFLLSKQAFIIAETAFTDPSLLALLYFPDDQKYAVYIPLFLPVMIPVLLSLKNMKKYFTRVKTSDKNDTDDDSSTKVKTN